MDRPRTLKFTLQNMAKAERLIAQRENMRFIKFNEILQPFGHTAERLNIALLYGLMHEDDKLTEEKVSDIYEQYVSKFEATETEGAYFQCLEGHRGRGYKCIRPFEAQAERPGSSGGEPTGQEFTYERAIRRGVEELGLLPSEAWDLTPHELNMLYMHKKKEDRREKYNLYLSVWWVNHKEGDEPASMEAFMPMPGDPGYEPPKKEPTVDECKEMMARNGEGEAG